MPVSEEAGAAFAVAGTSSPMANTTANTNLVSFTVSPSRIAVYYAEIMTKVNSLYDNFTIRPA